jgi:hypothetical protein
MTLKGGLSFLTNSGTKGYGDKKINSAVQSLCESVY